MENYNKAEPFEAQLKKFLATEGVIFEPRMLMLMIDGKEISISDLHMEVLRKGGSMVVSRRP